MIEIAANQEDNWDELIGGKVVMMAPAALNHVLIGGNIYAIFSNYLREKSCTPVPDGASVYLTDEDHFVPDFSVVCEKSKIHPDGIYGAPDLVVEILSPGTAARDKDDKKSVYERCGVREYWIVSPTEKIVEQYILREGAFVLHQTYAVYPEWMLNKVKPEERAAVITEFRCSLYDDLVIRLDDIFARV